MSSAAEIAAGLTKARQEIVLAMSEEFQSPAMMGVSRYKVAGLCRAMPELIGREWQDGCANCTYYRLKPLGLEVRRILQENDDA